MKAYGEFAGFVDCAQTFLPADRSTPADGKAPGNERELHNARGLVMSLMFSLGCWAAIGLAFFL